MVPTDFFQYKNSFLFALAVYWVIEIPTLELSATASSVAFDILELLQQTPAEQQDDAEPAESAEGPVLMEWDILKMPLPEEMRVLWEGEQEGTRKLPLRKLLDGLPKFGGIRLCTILWPWQVVAVAGDQKTVAGDRGRRLVSVRSLVTATKRSTFALFPPLTTGFSLLHHAMS